MSDLVVFFLEKENDMASDGDMFVQRKAWGYNKLCAAVCDNSPTEKLAEIETQSVCNMLNNGHAIPSLNCALCRARHRNSGPIPGFMRKYIRRHV